MPMKIATKRIPNIYELFYDKQGNLLSSPDVISFKAQDNYANVLLINLEDGIEDNDLVLINFTPKNAVIDYTTHWFYVRPLKRIREYIIDGENAPRTFSTYLYEVPRIVLNNYIKDTTVENEITIVKRYGLNNLGVFNKYSDLTTDNPATQELYDTNGFAYVLNNQTIGSVLHKSGYYQVIEVSNGVYEWTIRENVINYGLEQKQYEVKTAFTEAGYANVDNVPNVEGTVVEALWRDLASITNDIIDLQTFYELQFAPQETNTIALTFNKVNNSYFTVEANVKIDENNNDLLETSSDGLYVKHDDTKQDKLIAGDNITIDPNTNVISSKDERLDDEVIRVEQKVDTHIEDLNNPHGVTAEQVDTYVKTTIDNKDANTLQEAKDFTYDRDTIDSKDSVALQEAKDYTYSKVEIDNKDTAIMNKANNLENANMLKDVVYNNVNGVLTFTKYDDTTKEIDLPLELIVTSGYYDEVANELVLVLANSSEIRIPVDNLLTDLDAHNIRFNGSGTNYLVNKNDVESAIKELDTQVKGANDLLEDKVDKVNGKGLSTNDYTNVDKNKVDLIETEGDGTKYFGDDGQYHDESTIDELLGNLTTLGFVKRSGTNTYIIDTSTYQPLDADLTSIAGLSGTSGFLKKTSSNTWSLDTSVYLTSITKAMVETVLTGTITTHTHNASDIVEDATHRFVTDTEKSTWNAKQEALPTITQAEINAGTSTTEVVITPKLLRDNFYTETEIDNMIGDIESVLDTILGV